MLITQSFTLHISWDKKFFNFIDSSYITYFKLMPLPHVFT